MAFPIYDAPNPLDSILGRFNTDDPAKQARLAQSLALLQAGGPSRVPVSLFQGLGMAGQAGLEARRQAQKDAQAKLLQDMQLQQFTSQQDELKRRRTQQEALSNLWKSSMTPGGPGMPANEMDSGMDMGQQAPQFDRNKFIQGLGNIDPMEAFKLTQPKERKLTNVAPGATVIDDSGRTVFVNPDRPDKPTSDIQNFEFAKASGFKGTFNDWLLQKARAGASNVSVNTGQRGLDNTLKVRGDFRSEPVYKAHQEMQSAYSQIQQSLKQASPAGDLAGATKIMKLLDPGSVVRESELGMAMAASGLLDRVQNYAQNVLQGTKLTPTQRKDFQALADALYGESVKQYNKKRGEYRGIAERNQLDVRDVLGDESEGPSAPGSPADPLGLRGRR